VSDAAADPGVEPAAARRGSRAVLAAGAKLGALRYSGLGPRLRELLR